MVVGYRYKLRLSKSTQVAVGQWLGSTRWVYNWALSQKKQAYENDKTSLSWIDLCKKLPELKREYEWLSTTPAVSLQQSIRNIDTAYKKFFKEKKGFPRFKSKHSHRDSARIVGKVKVDFESGMVVLPKIGRVRFFTDPRKPNGKVSSATISKDSVGNYWISFVVEELSSRKIQHPKTSVGLDLGIKYFLVSSDGLVVDNPRFLEKGFRRLKAQQRILSRRVKGSSRRERQRRKVAVLHLRIRNKRINFLHHLSKQLCRTYSTICIEDLNIKGMQANHRLASSIASVSWNEFVRQLTYKSQWYGGEVLHIGRFEPSSKMCNYCGYINKDLKLSDRSWVCPVCSAHLDRDLNAAKNIKSIAVGATVNGRGATAMAGC